MSTPDLVRLEIAGRWDGPAHPRPVGRALNSWLFGHLAVIDPRSAEALHDLSAVKPVTISMPMRPAPRIVVTGYGPCAEPVLQLADRLPEKLLLDGQWWNLAAADAHQVRAVSWGEVAAPLVDPHATWRARFEFQTPTTFHSKGRFLPLPMPDLTLLGLLDRWTRWSNIQLGPDAKEVIEACAILGSFRGESIPYQLAGHVTGFVGWAEFAFKRPPDAYSGLLATLSAFAPFAGVGQKVGMGMGCVDTYPARQQGRPPGN